MSIYNVNNKPSEDKIEKYNEDNYTYFRFQCKDWEIGTKSWGMIFATEEEAIEESESWGIEKPILNGKSCCSTAEDLYSIAEQFDKDFRVLVLNGNYVEEGHDGEDVVDVKEIIEIWDYDDFFKIMNEITGL